MKYTIEGFSQQFAMTLKKEVTVGQKTVVKKIDCTDLVILRWFVDFYPNMRKVNVEGKEFAWLTHKKLQEDLPLVDITKRSFIDRMQKLVEFDILTYKLLKEGGTFSLYGFGTNYINLISNPNTRANVQPTEGMQSNDIGVYNQPTQGILLNEIGVVQSNDIGVCNQPTNKDTSIKNPSISDTSIKDTSIKDTKKNNIKGNAFNPPTVEEVAAYCKERNNTVDPEHFVDYYTAIGWKVGKNSMKDWKASVRTWERNQANQAQKNIKQNNSYGQTGVKIKQPVKNDPLEGIFKKSKGM